MTQGKGAAKIKIYNHSDVCVPDTTGKSWCTPNVDDLDQ